MSTERALKVSDQIKDNDPRTSNRVLTIKVLHPYGVVAHNVRGRPFSILKRRIHTDGKPRRSGFSLVAAIEQEARTK